MKVTPNHLIHIGKPIPFDTDVFLEQLQDLMIAAYNGQEQEIHKLIAQTVTTYHPMGAQSADDRQIKTAAPALTGAE